MSDGLLVFGEMNIQIGISYKGITFAIVKIIYTIR